MLDDHSQVGTVTVFCCDWIGPGPDDKRATPVVNAPVASSSSRSVQHIERTGSVGLAAAVAGGSYSRTAVTVTISEGGSTTGFALILYHSYEWASVQSLQWACLGHGSKYSRGSSPVAAPAGNDDVDVPIVEMRQQHRHAEIGLVRSGPKTQDTTRPLLAVLL
jgi:hypothetical protein